MIQVARFLDTSFIEVILNPSYMYSIQDQPIPVKTAFTTLIVEYWEAHYRFGADIYYHNERYKHILGMISLDSPYHDKYNFATLAW